MSPNHVFPEKIFRYDSLPNYQQFLTQSRSTDSQTENEVKIDRFSVNFYYIIG